MAKQRKVIEDYEREPTKSVTLSIPISDWQMLEAFAEATHRPLNDVVSEIFSDTAIVSIRRMLARNATLVKKEKHGPKAAKTGELAVPALLDPADTKLPLPATPPPDLPTPLVDYAVPSKKQLSQERPMPMAVQLQSSHQPPSEPPSRPASPLVAPHTRPEGNSPVPSESRPAASGPQPNFLPSSPSPTRSPMPPLQSTTKPIDEPPQKPPTQA